MTRRNSRWIGIAAVSLACSASVFCADSPLSQIPGEPVLVIQVRGLERTRARLVTLAREMDAKLEALATELATFLQGLIPHGAKLEGLDPEGFTALVLRSLPAERGMPFEWSLIARVRDREALTRSIEARGDRPKDVLTVTGDFALITRDASFVADLSSVKARWDTFLEPELASALLTHDIAIFVNTRKVRTESAGYVESFFSLSEMFSAGLKGPFSRLWRRKAPEPAPKARPLDELRRQLLVEARGIVVGCDFRDGGAQLHAEVFRETERPGTVSRPPGMALVGRLPAGCSAYGYRLGAARDSPPDAEGSPRALAFAENALLVLEPASDPARLAAERKAKLAVVATESTPKDKRVGAMTFDRFVSNRDSLELSVDLLEQEVQDELPGMFRQTLVGWLEGPTSTWIGHDDSQNLAISAKSWEDAQELVERVLDRRFLASQDPAWTDAIRQLPREATGFCVVSAQFIDRLLSDVQPPLSPRAQLPRLVHRSYMAFAITSSARITLFDVWMPAAALQVIKGHIDRGFAARSR